MGIEEMSDWKKYENSNVSIIISQYIDRCHKSFYVQYQNNSAKLVSTGDVLSFDKYNGPEFYVSLVVDNVLKLRLISEANNLDNDITRYVDRGIMLFTLNNKKYEC